MPTSRRPRDNLGPGLADPLIGRERETELIARELGHVQAGAGRAVLITGDPGVGKTALLDAALAHTHQTFGVHRAAAVGLERERPFGLLARALAGGPAGQPVRKVLADLLEDSPGSPTLDDEPGLGFRVEQDLLSAIEQMAATGPLLIALDDLQWSDSETVGALYRLARSLASLPIGLLLTLRPESGWTELQSLIHGLELIGSEHLLLRPLRAGEVLRLAERVLGARPTERLGQVLVPAGGNPLLVKERLAALERAGALTISGGRADATASNPLGMAAAPDRRLDGLSASARHLVQMGAVLGNAFSLDDLSLVTGRPVTDLMPDIAGAVRDRIFEVGDEVRFRHDLVREAVYASLAPGLRKALHRQAARTLATAGIAVSRVAAHMSLGAEPGDLEAIRWLQQASRSPAHAPEIRVELLQRALTLCDVRDRTRTELETDLLVALGYAARPAEAEEVANTLFDGLEDGHSRLRASRALARALMLGAKWNRAEAQLRKLIDEEPESGRPLVLAACAIAASSGGREIAETNRLAQLAIQTAERVGDPLGLALGHQAAALACWWTGDVAGMLLHMVGRVSELKHELDAEPLAWRLADRPLLLIDTDHISPADEALADLAVVVSSTRSPALTYIRQVWLVRRHYLSGNWDDAVAEAEAGIAFADETGVSWGWMALRPDLARIAFHRNQLELASELLPTAGAMSERGSNPAAAPIFGTLALLRLQRGDGPGALEAARSALALCQQGPLPWCPPVALDVVRVASALGAHSEAQGAVTTLTDAAARLGYASAQAYALQGRGLVDEDPQLLVRAVEAFRLSPRIPALAAACEDAGELTAGSVGITLLKESRDLFEQLGALLDLSRLEASLRRKGVRRGVRGTRVRPQVGWDSLTVTESRVVSLVAEGLSNPEIAMRLFISRNTVQTHLAHIFGKLQVASRTQLVAAVFGREPG